MDEKWYPFFSFGRKHLSMLQLRNRFSQTSIEIRHGRVISLYADIPSYFRILRENYSNIIAADGQVLSNMVLAMQYYKSLLHLDVVDRYLRRLMVDKSIPDEGPSHLESLYPP